MIATLFSCRQHKEFRVINCNRFVLFCIKFTQQKMFIQFFLRVCDSGYWLLRMSQLLVAKWRWAARITPVLYSVHVPCDFTSSLSKLSRIIFFWHYSVFSLSTEKLIQQAFHLLGLMPVISLKERERERICNTGMFGSFCGSHHSTLGCPDCLLWVCHQPPASLPSAKYLWVSSKSLRCHCAKQLQMFLSSTDIFILLHLFPLFHLSSLVSLHVCPWTAEIERIL